MSEGQRKKRQTRRGNLRGAREEGEKKRTKKGARRTIERERKGRGEHGHKKGGGKGRQRARLGCGVLRDGGFVVSHRVTANAFTLRTDRHNFIPHCYELCNALHVSL